jgi:hypothetical protein
MMSIQEQNQTLLSANMKLLEENKAIHEENKQLEEYVNKTLAEFEQRLRQMQMNP